MPSNDDLNKQIEFILHQQAQFYADLRRTDAHIQQISKFIEKVSEQIDKQSRQIEQHSLQIDEQSRQIEQHSLQIERHSEDIRRLAGIASGIVQVVNSQGDRFEAQMEKLVASQQATDQRLNVLIDVVERYFSNGGGGR